MVDFKEFGWGISLATPPTANIQERFDLSVQSGLEFGWGISSVTPPTANVQRPKYVFENHSLPFITAWRLGKFPEFISQNVCCRWGVLKNVERTNPSPELKYCILDKAPWPPKTRKSRVWKRNLGLPSFALPTSQFIFDTFEAWIEALRRSGSLLKRFIEPSECQVYPG